MKSIFVLLGSAYALDKISPAVTFASTLNCAQCIRNGYVFCTDTSALFQSAATLPANNQCCNPALALDSTNCSAGYTSTAGTLKAGASCNQSFSSLDKQLLSCPQLNTVCDGPNVVNTFANKDATKVTKTITTFSNTQSCTYVVKATCDAPGFRVTGMSHPEKFLIHFYEYSSTTAKDANTDFPNINNSGNGGFDEKKVFNAPNQPNGEFGYFKHVINATLPTNYQYVPGSTIWNELKAK